MLYKEYTINLFEISRLSEVERRIVTLNGRNSKTYLYQDEAILYPWVAAVSVLRVFESRRYRPGLVWCSDFAVGAQTPAKALELAKFKIDARKKPQFEIF